MKWLVDFPSRIKGKPWLAYYVVADTKEQAKARAHTLLALDGEHTHHYRQPKAVKLREQAA